MVSGSLGINASLLPPYGNDQHAWLIHYMGALMIRSLCTHKIPATNQRFNIKQAMAAPVFFFFVFFFLGGGGANDGQEEYAKFDVM